MALPRDVFKEKMAEGRRLAKERREEDVKSRQQQMMEKAVEERAREIETQEAAYGGYSEMSKSSVSQEPDIRGRGNGGSRNHSVPDLQRSERSPEAGVAAQDSAGSPSPEDAFSCKLCRGFPWTNVPLEVARRRFHWLSGEFARIAGIISQREAENSRKNGCSICGGFPMIHDHWYSVKTNIDRATGVEHTLYACSQPCYVRWAEKFPQYFGVTRGGGWNPSP